MTAVQVKSLETDPGRNSVSLRVDRDLALHVRPAVALGEEELPVLDHGHGHAGHVVGLELAAHEAVHEGLELLGAAEAAAGQRLRRGRLDGPVGRVASRVEGARGRGGRARRRPGGRGPRRGRPCGTARRGVTSRVMAIRLPKSRSGLAGRLQHLMLRRLIPSRTAVSRQGGPDSSPGLTPATLDALIAPRQHALRASAGGGSCVLRERASSP